MKYFLKYAMFSITLFTFISCGSTDSGETGKKSLENIIPNRTWYLIQPGTNGEQYAKHIYGDLNSEMTGTYHEFPCGSESLYEANTLEYEVISNIKFQLGNKIYDVLDYSENQFRLEDTGQNGGKVLVFKTSCQDLK